MRIKNLIEEDFVQYKLPSMFIGTCFCTFKCGAENCQNSALVDGRIIDIPDDDLILRYLNNPLTQSIVFGGLEPFDQFEELEWFLKRLRGKYGCKDPVVIYSGYTEEELADRYISDPNLIVKVGRYLPDKSSRYDPLLGVTLASDNQHAVDWSDTSAQDNPKS